MSLFVKKESKNKNAGIAMIGCGILATTANIDAVHTFIPCDINSNETAMPSGILCIAKDTMTNKPML